MFNTKEFMSFDANPAHNDFDMIEKYLSGSGVWVYFIESRIISAS